MKRRTFFKGTAVGAAAAAAPTIWSDAKAQARNETLLIVGESPPNSMDIHGVGANRPAYDCNSQPEILQKANQYQTVPRASCPPCHTQQKGD